MTTSLLLAPQAMAEYGSLLVGTWAEVQRLAGRAWQFGAENWILVVAVGVGLAVILALMAPRVR